MTDQIQLYQEQLKKALRRKFRGTMSPTENVLYFPNNIDMRICPKNGMSTLKWVLLYALNINISQKNQEALRIGTKNWRIEQIKEYGYQDELPFRQDSIRLAVSRDPVKRFLSACEYIKTEWIKSKDLFDVREDGDYSQLIKLSDVDSLPDDLDGVIDMVWSGEIHNSHFFTQTYYQGSRGQYDHIYPLREFTSLLNYLRSQTNCQRDIARIHANRTSGLYYGGVDKLTTNQRRLIMRIYEEDYDYGWTET